MTPVPPILAEYATAIKRRFLCFSTSAALLSEILPPSCWLTTLNVLKLFPYRNGEKIIDALMTYRNHNVFNLYVIFCALTVCLICGARCLFPADGFGCLSIEAGAAFLSDSTIGSLSLEVN